MDKLNKTAVGLATGIVWGVSIFLLTVMVMSRDGTKEMLMKLHRIYIGYSVTLQGAIIGLIYGFINGFVVGWFWASLYNLFSKIPQNTEEESEEVEE